MQDVKVKFCRGVKQWAENVLIQEKRKFQLVFL